MPIISMNKRITSTGKKPLNGVVIPGNLRVVAGSELLRNKQGSLLIYGFVNHDQWKNIKKEAIVLAEHSGREKLFKALGANDGSINLDSVNNTQVLIEKMQFNKFELKSKGYIEQAIILDSFTKIHIDNYVLLKDVPSNFYQKLSNDGEIQKLVIKEQQRQDKKWDKLGKQKLKDKKK